jgi:hypothetical protein
MKRQDGMLSPELAGHVDSFSRLALELPGRMAAVCLEIEEIEARLRVLAAHGVVRAGQNWRWRRREGTCSMPVCAPGASGQRWRRYIGKDPAKVKEALKALARAEEYERLTARLYRLMAGSFAASYELSKAFQALTCYRP